MYLQFAISLLSISGLVTSQCYDHSPAFPQPTWENGKHDLASTFTTLEAELKKLVSAEKFDGSSYSIALTSYAETLWSTHHTARKHNESRPGTKHVDENSLYRIASITKTFTVLGVLYQHEQGNLRLDESIKKYIPELEGDLPWRDITLRILASQLSGIPREFAQSDFLNEYDDPTSVGLPPAEDTDYLPSCDEYNQYIPCDASDLLKRLQKQQPLFAPNQKSTYSNVAFELLGLATEKVTGMSYKEYMQKAIFDPIEMTTTSLDTPSDEHAVLPVLKDGETPHWDVDLGIQNPTGGIYSNTKDLSKYLRYILTHYNTIAKGVNWFQPASFATGLRNFYGMPWEIFATERILEHSTRPIVFTTKAGGYPGYSTRIIFIEQYGLGFTVLTAGEYKLLEEIVDLVTVRVVRAAESLIWKRIAREYDGTYFAIDKSLNSSITLSSSPIKGLTLDSFISNSTDILGENGLFGPKVFGTFDKAGRKTVPQHLQLVPTLLFKDEEHQRGEIWRFVPSKEHPVDKDESRFPSKIWDEACHTDIDNSRYAGLPTNEVVFWHDEGLIELPAWKVKMRKQEDSESEPRLVVQG